MEKYAKNTEYQVECRATGQSWFRIFASELYSDAERVLHAKRTLTSIFKEHMEYRLLSVTTEQID